MTLGPKILLAPLAGAYGLAVRGRALLFKAGIFARRSLEAPVISVGNLTTGGTGKTPLVEWLARVLSHDYGLRVCILTRGYRRNSKHRRVVVSDGQRILSDAAEGGDEPRLLGENLRGIAAVISDTNRAAAGEWAIKNFGSNAFILDDGFQHLSLTRTLDLLTVDSTDAFDDGRLLPQGHLREPISAITRADCIIITRAEQSNDVSVLEAKLDRLSGGVPVVTSYMNSVGLRTLAPHTDKATFIPPLNYPVAAFCGIGNPGAFFKQLRAAGNDLSYVRAFPDHYLYTSADLKRVVTEARQSGAGALITTAKDAVKLHSFGFDMPCYVLEIEVRFNEERKLLKVIEKAIKSILSP